MITNPRRHVEDDKDGKRDWKRKDLGVFNIMQKIIDFMYSYFKNLTEYRFFHITSISAIVFCILCVSDWEKVSSLLTALGTIALVWYAYIQTKLVEKQKEISRHQEELQRCSVVYDVFMKSKQEKIIELRHLYMSFEEICIFFISLFFPAGIMPKNQVFGKLPQIDLSSQDDSDVIPTYYTEKRTEFIENFFNEAILNAKKFNSFLMDNDIFLGKNTEVIEDLKAVSRDFSELFFDINSKESLKIKFSSLAKELVSFRNDVSNGYYTNNKQTLIELRNYFYIFMHGRLMLKRGNFNDSLLYMLPMSPFKGIPYTHENIIKWSHNEKKAFATLFIFQNWFGAWKSHLDNILLFSFEKVRKVVEND